jgi:hypothetical protein
MLIWHYSKNKTVGLGYVDLGFEQDNIGHAGEVDSEIELKGPIFNHTFQF